MLKRLAIFFVLLSFAGLQAHNIIPHHHEIEIAEPGHHHDDHHDQDDADNEYPVSAFSHTAEFGKLGAKNYQFIEVEKPVFITGLINLYVETDQDENPPDYHPPDFVPIQLSFLFNDLPLRAPPALSIRS